jgi:undecaprenyl-diphosphatase
VRPLAARRRTAAAAVLVSTLAVAAGAVAFHDDTGRTRVDRWVSARIAGHLSAEWQLRALDLTDPRAVTGLIVLTAVGAAVLGRRRLALLAALGPLAALGLTELVLKPLVHRRFRQFDGHHGLSGNAYPSGHETGLSSLTLLLALTVFALTTAMALRVLALTAAAIVDVLGGIGLVGRDFHVATDVVAAVGVSTAVLLGLALLLDDLGRRRRRVGAGSLSSPDGPGRPSTAHAA